MEMWLLLLIADAEEAKQIYRENKNKAVFRDVHLAYPANHTLFYNAIHGETLSSFWGLRSVEKQEHDLTGITQENYKEVIFGTIEELAKI